MILRHIGFTYEEINVLIKILDDVQPNITHHEALIKQRVRDKLVNSL